ALGSVIGGPVASGGFNWWNINYDTGVDGWSAENYLVKAPTVTPPPPPPPPPSATTGFVQGSVASIFSASSIRATFSSNVTAGDVIAVGVLAVDPTATVTSITAGCVSGNFTLLDGSIKSSAGSSGAQGYAVISSSGPCTVTANFSAPAAGAAITVHEISGINTSSPLDGHAMAAQNSPGTATNAVTSGNITTTQSGDYIFGIALDSSRVGAVFTAGTGYAARVTSASWLETEDKIQTSSGAVAATFSATPGYTQPITGIMAFRSAGAAVMPPPSTKFVIGDRVQVTASLNVRSVPSTSGTLLGTQPVGALGTVTGGPTNANGFNWWNINYDTGVDGWSAENYLVKAPAPPPPSDTTPPSVPIGFFATPVSSSQINLAWMASTDNVGVVGYLIYRGGTLIATTASTNYSDTNLTASTNYSYAVSAYDAAGNTSAQSTSANATTQATTVTPPPPPPPTGCYQSNASSWQNVPFAVQSSSFTATYDDTPNGNNMDGVTGLSLNAASG
ncbi:MAG TPA: hypothetical protein VG167_15880, partial [Verrucomicrobiae bacterium]|nr:hypothetical protein [Verrucomicrobiae bacterium]